MTALISLARDINEAHRAAEGSAKSAVEAARRCGELLAEAKSKVEHGEWLPWLAENFEGHRNTAATYMKLARNVAHARHLGKPESIRGALRELAGPKGNGLKVHHSSKSAEHYTPDHVLQLVAQVLGDIDLDPCADPEHDVCAGAHYDESADGLSQEWGGRVFMNPPYGNGIELWADKLCTSYESGRVTAAIALLPARPDTQWWARFHAYPVCFVSGRLTFKGNQDPAPFPSACIYLGRAQKRFEKHFSRLGKIYVPVGR